MKRFVVVLLALFALGQSGPPSTIKANNLSYTSYGITVSQLLTVPPQFDGTIVWVRDASVGPTCQSGGTGAWASHIHGSWNCNGLNLSSDCSDAIGPFNGLWSGLINAASCPGANAGAKIQAAANIAASMAGGIVNYDVAAGGSALVTSQVSFVSGVYFMLNGTLFDTTVAPTGQFQFTGSGGGMVCDGLPRYPDPSFLPSSSNFGPLTIGTCTYSAGFATCGWTGTGLVQAGKTMLTITGNSVSGYNLTHVLVTATPTSSSLSFAVASGLGTGTGGSAAWGTIAGSGIISAPASGLSPIIQFQPDTVSGGAANTNPLVKNCAFMGTAQVADDIDAAPNVQTEWVNIAGNVFGGFTATDHPPGWAVSISPYNTGVTNSVNYTDNYAYYHGYTTIPLTSCAESLNLATCLTASTLPAFYASLGGWPGFIYGVTGATGYNVVNDVIVEFNYVDSTHISFTATSSGLGAGSGGALYFGGAFQSNPGNTQGPNLYARNTGFQNGGPTLSLGPNFSFDPTVTQNSCEFPLATYVNEDLGLHLQDIDGLMAFSNPTECYDISRAGNTNQVGTVFVSSGQIISNTLSGNQTTVDSTQDPKYGFFSNKDSDVVFASNKITANLTAGWQSVGGAVQLTYLPNFWSQGAHDGAATEFGSSANGLTWVCPSNSNSAFNGYCGTGLNAAANPGDLVMAGRSGFAALWALVSGNHSLSFASATGRWSFSDMLFAVAACRGNTTLAAGVGTFSLDCLFGGANPVQCGSQDITAAHVPLTVSPISVGRTFADGVTNSTTTLTSATAAFVSGDVGRLVVGAGIPTVIGTTASYTYIASVTNGTTVVLSQAATATATGVSITLEPLVNLTNGTGTDVALTVCQ
jgi:hypothetical protein